MGSAEKFEVIDARDHVDSGVEYSSSRLLDASERCGRELSVHPVVADVLPNAWNAVLLPKRAHASQVQSVEFQELAYFSSDSSALLCRCPALL